MFISLAEALQPYSAFVCGHYIQVSNREDGDALIRAVLRLDRAVPGAVVDEMVSVCLDALESQLEQAILDFAASIGQVARVWHYEAIVQYE